MLVQRDATYLQSYSLTVAHLKLSVKQGIMICISCLSFGRMSHMALYGIIWHYLALYDIVWSPELFYH